MINLALSRASRNARVIGWLKGQPIETLDNVRALYAGHLGCPLDETVALDVGPLDDDTLTFVYSLFASQIDG